MQIEHKQPVLRKITPTEVKEEPEKKIEVEPKKKSNCAGTPEKTVPSTAEKKQKKNVAKERKKEYKESVAFPVDSRINAYGFVFLKMKWLKALGWHKGIALKIDKNPDGSVTIRRA